MAFLAAVHSQNNEETIITDFFGEKLDGRALDIGAYNGATFSNTLALFERGWGGVCVEPSPGPFLGLLKIHGGNPNIKLVQTAVVPDSAGLLVEFSDSGGDAISTLNAAHRARWESAGSKFLPFFLRPISLLALFAAVGYEFDFINLDVEGTNWELFRRLPFANLARLKLICVEHDGRTSAMLELVEPHGFRVLASNGENVIFGRA